MGEHLRDPGERTEEEQSEKENENARGTSIIR